MRLTRSKLRRLILNEIRLLEQAKAGRSPGVAAFIKKLKKHGFKILKVVDGDRETEIITDGKGDEGPFDMGVEYDDGRIGFLVDNKTGEQNLPA